MRVRLLFLLMMAAAPYLWAQSSVKSTVVPESIVVSSDSATTVLGWFHYIEQQGVRLSYNVSKIDLAERIKIHKQTTTVINLLSQVLSSYDFSVRIGAYRKVLLQIQRRKSYEVSGYIVDAETRLGLEGCLLQVKLMKGRTYSTLTDTTGHFHFQLPAGNYSVQTSYVGYQPLSKYVSIQSNSSFHFTLSQMAIPIKEIIVKSSPLMDEINRIGATNLLSVASDDPFAQLNALPGVYGKAVNGDFHVNGGQNDENLILMDGVAIYHSHHNNSQLAQFNGETVKKVAFYDSFIPAQYEGRLSSVTDVQIKSGDTLHHHQAIALDLPTASLTLDGPILKNKLTYMVSARHSWVDFLEHVFSDETKTSRSFWDFTGKLGYQVNKSISVEGLVYHSKDQYNDTLDEVRNQKILAWNTNLYSLSVNASLPHQITSSHTMAFTEYENKIYAPFINIKAPVFITEGMHKFFIKSAYAKKLDEFVDLSWGLTLSQENYNLLASKDTVENNTQKITQLSSFVSTKMKFSEHFYGNAALNIVSYLPGNYTKFYSIQPRFSVRYQPSNKHTFSFDFSRMEQFYHNICLGEIPLPTDLRMPSIQGFKPSSSIHCELSWKYIEPHWRTTLSSFYKRRFDILGVRYFMDLEKEGWNQFIMAGDGASYGLKLHALGHWNKWLVDFSYTYSRSHEWYDEYKHSEKVPTLYDIPHMAHFAAAYKTGKNSHLSLGGYIKSGNLANIFADSSTDGQFISYRERQKCNYRIDMNYSGTKRTKEERLILSYKIGIYNIVGNPKENEVIDLYSIDTKKHCLPYFSLKLNF